MMLLILDCADGPLPPYPEWLDGADAVLFTARSQAELADCNVDGYADVRCFADYATSARLEREAIRLAHSSPLSAIVAIAAEDAIRAAGLRDLLGVGGTSRREAIALRDLVSLRARLERHGVPTLRCAPVERVSDLYWHGHRWGYPLRVRQRRAIGWPVAAELCDESDVAAYTRGGLSPRLESPPSLVVEKVSSDERRIRLARDENGAWDVPPACPALALARARRALALMAPSGDGASSLQLVSVGAVAAADWCVDAIVERSDPRTRARAQAASQARVLEVAR